MATPSPAERSARTEAARAAQLHNAAVRAVEDPVRLARAARIVRVALERRRLRLADLAPEVRPGDDPTGRHDAGDTDGTTKNPKAATTGEA